jgi:hypothetical protein
MRLLFKSKRQRLGWSPTSNVFPDSRLVRQRFQRITHERTAPEDDGLVKRIVVWVGQSVP